MSSVCFILNLTRIERENTGEKMIQLLTACLIAKLKFKVYRGRQQMQG